jgi:hypothetical protein
MAREQAERHFSLLCPPPFCLPFILRSGATGCRLRVLSNSSRNFCGEALDDEPAASASKEVANRTGSINHDKADERAHNEAIVITDKLHADIEDLEIQRPQRNSPKPKKTSQRLTVPLGSTIVDSTVGPFTANSEHLDKSPQTPVNESAEQTGEGDQPYPNGPAAGGGHLEAGLFILS